MKISLSSNFNGMFVRGDGSGIEKNEGQGKMMGG